MVSFSRYFTVSITYQPPLVSGSNWDHDHQIFVNPIMPWHNLETSRCTCTTISSSSPLPSLTYLSTYLPTSVILTSSLWSWQLDCCVKIWFGALTEFCFGWTPMSLSLTWCHGPVSFELGDFLSHATSSGTLLVNLRVISSCLCCCSATSKYRHTICICIVYHHVHCHHCLIVRLSLCYLFVLCVCVTRTPCFHKFC